ncbi:MAG: sulfotransferase, partial [Candidatus Latescibacterota bacterium]
MKVVGAGLGRTGTYSLMTALEHLLGAPCYHMFVAANLPDHTQIWHDAS